jgi:hypothetical protein
MSRSSLVGRRAEIEMLAEAVDELRSGSGSLVLLVGEPGIGKSRLAEETARLAEAAQLRAVFGRAWEAGGAPAFWPWIQVLRGLAPGVDPLGGARGASSPEDRFLLFDATTRALGDACREAPAVAILEDAHAIDDASLHLLAFVAQHLRTMNLLVVATYRDVEARLTPAAGAVLERLSRAARVIAPRRLERAEIAELADGLDADAVATLYQQSEGNPLFVTELLRVLRRRGGPIVVPAGVRTAIREHLRVLPADLLPVLEIAAVIGREFAASHVAELCARPIDQVLDAFGTAVELGVLVERAPARFAFAHGLIAETLHHDLAAARRAQLHLAVAETLERTAAPLTEIAHHLFGAGPDHAQRAADMALRAAEQARRQLAFEPAAALVERGLQILPPGNAVGRFELMRLLGEVRLLADDADRGREAAREAAALARSIGSPELLARAALTYGGSWSFGFTDQVLLQLLEEALAALPAGDHPLRARMLARLASALQPARDTSVPIAIARDAIAMAERLGDDRTKLDVFFSASGALVLFGPPAERRTLNLATVALAERFGEPLMALRSHHRLVFDHAELSDLAGLAIHHRCYDELVERLRLSRARWPSAMMRAMLALVEGRMAEHDEAVAEAQRLADEVGDGFLRVTLVGHRVAELTQCASSDEIRANHHVYQAMSGWGGQGWTYPDVLACYHVRVGELETGRAMLPRDRVEALLAHRLLERGNDLAHAVWLLDDRELAAMLYDWLATEGTRMGALHSHGYAIGRTAAHSAMLLAATLGDLAAARRHFDAAAPVLRAMNARPQEAWLFVHFATILSRTRDPAVQDEVARLAAKARAYAAECRVSLEAQLAELETPAPPRSVAITPEVQMACEGETWIIEGLGLSCRLKASRGVELLSRLVAEPMRELHVLELVGTDVIDDGDAGEVLDAAAKLAYKNRLGELREGLEEAERWNDIARAERARDEIDALESELSRATGLGGRSRRVGRAAERARINVQRRLADTIRRIADVAPELGRHLGVTIRTGIYCSYSPDRAPRR